MHFKTRTDVFLDLGAQGATPNSELDANGDHPVDHGDVASHAEVDDVVAQFGVYDSPQEVTNLFFGGGRWCPGAHIINPTGVLLMHAPVPIIGEVQVQSFGGPP